MIMKKMMMILVSAIMMSASSFAAENTNVEPFVGVYVNAPVRMRFVYGDEYTVNVRSADALAASAIRMTVTDGILKIRSLGESEAMSNVCITVVSPIEPRLTVGRNMEVKNLVHGHCALANK